MDRGACVYINTFVNIYVYIYKYYSLVKLYKISLVCDISSVRLSDPTSFSMIFDDEKIRWFAANFFKNSNLLI